VVDPALEMRRVVGKLAFLFAGVYLIVLFGAVFSAAIGKRLPLVAWPLMLIPAAAFVPAVVDGFRLHLTEDPTAMKALWPRCLLYSGIGMVLFIATAFAVERITL
jgi:hypothetical protein